MTKRERKKMAGKIFKPGMAAGPEDGTPEKDVYEELGRMVERERS
jgi:hypothetical protein